MAITTRSTRVQYPGCITIVDEPYVCATYTALQDLARALQECIIEGKGASIAGGKIYTDASAAEVACECEAT